MEVEKGPDLEISMMMKSKIISLKGKNHYNF